jgi:hypothetical protein
VILPKMRAKMASYLLRKTYGLDTIEHTATPESPPKQGKNYSPKTTKFEKKRGRPRQTHCNRGHEMADPNLIHVKSTGARMCKKCYNERQRAYYHLKKGKTTIPPKQPYVKRPGLTGAFEYWMPESCLPEIKQLTPEQANEEIPNVDPRTKEVVHWKRGEHAGEVQMIPRREVREAFYHHNESEKADAKARK